MPTKKVEPQNNNADSKKSNTASIEKKDIANKKSCPHCEQTRKRNPEEYNKLINRLNRVEGQIRGIRGMLAEDAYCIDILTQVAAANAALNSFNKVLLEQHMKTCVAQDIREGKEEKLEELVKTLQKLMK